MSCNAKRCLVIFWVSLAGATKCETQAAVKPLAPRAVIDLGGTWQVEQGGMERPPSDYGHAVPVPGLIDLALPAFSAVGQKSSQRQAFWYRRTFRVDRPIPKVALLKVHKAKYGIKVWLNGILVGQQLACFTPGYFDVQQALKGDDQENELVIRVGADRDALPQNMPTGWDFEKYLYLPGIYDAVELILTGRPFLRNVQVVPDLQNSQVRVVADIECGPQATEVVLTGKVMPWRGTEAVGEARITVAPENGTDRAELTVMIPDYEAWSPEHPFLYEVQLSTGADAARVRFGMRSFHFDRSTKRAHAERQALLPARQQRDVVSVLRGCGTRRSAVALGLGSPASPTS